MKHCPRCKTDKPVEEFHKSKKSPDGRQCYCKTCRKTMSADSYRSKSKEEQRDIYYKRYYGLSYDEVQLMLDDQGFTCAICPKDITDKFHVDHCHTTGTVRGLLCPQCNHMLGLSYDNPNTLERAASYLREANERGLPSLPDADLE